MSDAKTLNKQDWLDAGKAALIWSTPIWLFYITDVAKLIGTFGHNVSLNDFIPSQLVINSAATWLVMQAQGLALRWKRGE